MKLDNILTKSEFTTEEMIFVVEAYIKEKKNKSVQINPPNTQIRVVLLCNFFNTAMDYFLAKLNPFEKSE